MSWGGFLLGMGFEPEGVWRVMKDGGWGMFGRKVWVFGDVELARGECVSFLGRCW